MATVPLNVTLGTHSHEKRVVLCSIQTPVETVLLSDWLDCCSNMLLQREYAVV